MADTNVAIVERIFAGFAQRDNAAVLRAYDPEVVWDARGAVRLPDLQGVYHGIEGVKTWWRRWLEAWETIEIIDGPHHETIGNQVVSTWLQRNRGKGSGVEIETDAGIVWTFERGRIVRAAVFTSSADARDAGGLPPD